MFGFQNVNSLDCDTGISYQQCLPCKFRQFENYIYISLLIWSKNYQGNEQLSKRNTTFNALF